MRCLIGTRHLVLPPEYIRIGPARYEIKSTKSAISEARGQVLEHASGVCFNDQGVIVLDPDLGMTQMQETLTHEVLHAVFYLAGIDDDEDPVRRIAPYVLMLLQQNPKLIDYLVSSQ